MRAVDAMILWTPNREPSKGWATAGRVEVTTLPQPDSVEEYQHSIGACDHDWDEIGEAGRFQRMQMCFSQMIHRDGIKEEVARAALSRIDGDPYRRLSSERPVSFEDSWQ